MEVHMKKLSILIAFLVAGLLTGCNTMRGAGQDIERGGEKLQDSAQRNR
jgi:predicted small secreted protein